MVERAATHRRIYPFVATKLAPVAKGVLAFVEVDPTTFLKAFKTMRRGDLRCEIVPAYGFDIIVCERLRIPIPAGSTHSGRTVMDHLAATGSIYVFVGSRDELVVAAALELTIETPDLLTAKGRYEMAALLRSKASEPLSALDGEAPASLPDDAPDVL